MKLHHPFIILSISTLFAIPSISFAAKGNKRNKPAATDQQAIVAARAYDKNNNGQIDGDEIDALKKDFAAAPKGPLAALDKNNSGTLEDDEITALNATLNEHPTPAAKGKGAKAGKGGKPAANLRQAIVAAKAYDKNNNNQIDGDEIDALKKDFTAAPKGPLAALDKNNSGTLEDDEITALNDRLTKRAERIAKKGKKKGDASSMHRQNPAGRHAHQGEAGNHPHHGKHKTGEHAHHGKAGKHHHHGKHQAGKHGHKNKAGKHGHHHHHARNEAHA